MDTINVVEVEELPQPEFTHLADSAGIYTFRSTFLRF